MCADPCEQHGVFCFSLFKSVLHFHYFEVDYVSSVILCHLSSSRLSLGANEMISASEERVTMYSAEIIVKQMNELKARFCGCMALFC